MSAETSISHAHNDHHDDHEEGGHHFEVVEIGVHHVESNKKEIWKVFFILLAITVLEFLVALTPFFKEVIPKGGIVGIYFFLTVLKAFYIVGYFMHLKHEKMNLAYSILIPILFIMYLIALLLFEGSDVLLTK